MEDTSNRGENVPDETTIASEDAATHISETTLPFDVAVPRLSRQCVCPHCGGGFGLDDIIAEPEPVMFDCRCMHCGHIWRSRNAEPARCPDCGVTGWKYTPGPCKCRRCDHEWVPRAKGHSPSKCPSCRSADWSYGSTMERAPMPPVDRPEVLRMAWILKKYGQGMGCIQIASRSGLALLDVIRIVRDETGTEEPELRRHPHGSRSWTG